jgi:hypothetical protein
VSGSQDASATPSETYISPEGVTYTRVPDAPKVEPTTPATTKVEAPAGTQPVQPATRDPAKPESTPSDPAKPAADPLAADGGIVKPDETKVDDKAAETPEPIKAEDYKLTLPEGVDAKTDPLIAGFLTAAAEQRLSNEQVQFLYDKMGPAIADNQRNAWAQNVTNWQQQVAADPEIGGDNQAATVARVNAALAKFGGSKGADGKTTLNEINQFLATTGAHSHPAFIRLINRMAAPLSEATPVVPGEGSGIRPAEKDAAALMYPTHAAGKAA